MAPRDRSQVRGPAGQGTGAKISSRDVPVPVCAGDRSVTGLVWDVDV